MADSVPSSPSSGGASSSAATWRSPAGKDMKVLLLQSTRVGPTGVQLVAVVHVMPITRRFAATTPDRDLAAGPPIRARARPKPGPCRMRWFGRLGAGHAL